jgi:molybdopterin converting factor small subunit
MRANLRCAIDQEYVDWETPLPDGAELALIPPTAGG